MCTLRTDGGGLYVLDDYGSNIRCDLRLKYVLFLAWYYAVILFPLSLLVVYASQSMVGLGRKMIKGSLWSAHRQDLWTDRVLADRWEWIESLEQMRSGICRCSYRIVSKVTLRGGCITRKLMQ